MWRRKRGGEACPPAGQAQAGEISSSHAGCPSTGAPSPNREREREKTCKLLHSHFPWPNHFSMSSPEVSLLLWPGLVCVSVCVRLRVCVSVCLCVWLCVWLSVDEVFLKVK